MDKNDTSFGNQEQVTSIPQLILILRWFWDVQTSSDVKNRNGFDPSYEKVLSTVHNRCLDNCVRSDVPVQGNLDDRIQGKRNHNPEAPHGLPALLLLRAWWVGCSASEAASSWALASSNWEFLHS